MVRADRSPPTAVNVENHVVSDTHDALLDPDSVHEQVVDVILGVVDYGEHAVGCYNLTGVSDLAAGLAVERCLVDYDGSIRAGFDLFDTLAIKDGAVTWPSACSVL